MDLTLPMQMSDRVAPSPDSDQRRIEIVATLRTDCLAFVAKTGAGANAAAILLDQTRMKVTARTWMD